MAYLEWILGIFLVLVFIAYWRLSNWKYYGKPILSFRNRILISVIFPILLVFLIIFGSLASLVILGVVVFIALAVLLFWIFGSRKVYFKKF